MTNDVAARINKRIEVYGSASVFSFYPTPRAITEVVRDGVFWTPHRQIVWNVRSVIVRMLRLEASPPKHKW